MGGKWTFMKRIIWGLIWLSFGALLALLFPLSLIAGIEALIIIIFGLTFCFKKRK